MPSGWISVLIKAIDQSLHSLPCAQWGHRKKAVICKPGKENQTRKRESWTSQSPEGWEINVCLSHWSMPFCYNSPSTLTQYTFLTPHSQLPTRHRTPPLQRHWVKKKRSRRGLQLKKKSPFYFFPNCQSSLHPGDPQNHLKAAHCGY
jgi:hypothetical protein